MLCFQVYGHVSKLIVVFSSLQSCFQAIFPSKNVILDGNDEAYNIYDKPWRSENTLSNHLYRPPKNRDNELYGDDIENIAKQKRFVPDKGFEGADASAGRGSGPVQFEKDAEDIFGIDKLLTDAKRVSFGINF